MANQTSPQSHRVLSKEFSLRKASSKKKKKKKRLDLFFRIRIFFSCSSSSVFELTHLKWAKQEKRQFGYADEEKINFDDEENVKERGARRYD